MGRSILCVYIYIFGRRISLVCVCASWSVGGRCSWVGCGLWAGSIPFLGFYIDLMVLLVGDKRLAHCKE